ncbi:glycerophosphoryl diester phosphodiesterase [Candidatus Protofrankia californiensis]|uniref:Glycerophosphoryl diester phosphodiesterase n=1 Tax=Candidatus Protofrankia californiensis TaxID=1839754 RepID=A0A1C3NVP4_9ACTN|nr:glycerophosphodiester phosphodiesterase [Candidatus Protofrankia californiensis]SBW19654.1 glycerophosphoryl diester phosphodiesterase [Candidatus Protofrankia californiensis]
MTRPAGRPIGFAHRGAPGRFQRENTLAAFRRALTGGAGGLESDVWLTADGVPVLHHDGVLGPPGRRRRISDLPAAQLPDRLPSLAGLYAACGSDFELSLDLKDPPQATRRAAQAVVGVARTAGAAGRLWLCGSLVAIRCWRSLDDVTGPDQVKLVNSASARDAGFRGHAGSGNLDAYVRDAAASGATVLNLRANEWSAPMVRSVHAGGLLAFGWHAQTSGTLNRLVGFGLDGVYSDHLDRLVRATGSETTITYTQHTDVK